MANDKMNPMSILLTIRDNGDYEIYSPTLSVFMTAGSWNVALELLTEIQGQLRDWKCWYDKGKEFRLRAEMAKHIRYLGDDNDGE